MTPPPPPRLSMTMVPRIGFTRSAQSLPMTSCTPAGTDGMTRRMGRLGYGSCAKAGHGGKAAVTLSSKASRRLIIGFGPIQSRLDDHAILLSRPERAAAVRTGRPARWNATPGNEISGRESMLRMLLAVAAVLAVHLHATSASAQSYPQRTVKLILPFGPA